MEISLIIQSIIIISILIAIGAFFSKTFSYNEHTRKMFISLIVNVAMPCIILSSIFQVDLNRETFKLIAFVFLISIFINLLGIGLGWGLANIFQKHSKKKRELAILSGLGNTGFIGIPLCAALIGPKGALFAAIFDAGVDFTIWTVGVFILQKKGSFTFQTLKAMVNIPTAAIVVGIVVAFFNIKPPHLLIQVTEQLAGMAAPLAMFYIGVLIMTLKRAKVRESSQQVWIPILVKLIIMPLVVALLIHIFSVEKEITQTLLIQSMMPSLTLATILFSKYSADEELGTVTTVLSTIISLSTIPSMFYFIN
ncbi:AEC family transporter [Neobacillus mesonae]|uniref:AEC family transporter n=1 Tax=Neobacillus mesonae TaxID=1193713 RepID=UPI0025739928|nr:AEC family transporter [Neobacillus mesonae]